MKKVSLDFYDFMAVRTLRKCSLEIIIILHRNGFRYIKYLREDTQQRWPLLMNSVYNIAHIISSQLLLDVFSITARLSGSIKLFIVKDMSRVVKYTYLFHLETFSPDKLTVRFTVLPKS